MGKHELSCSDCKAFKKYILKAVDSLVEQDYSVVRENIDSARDMVFDWRFDGKTDFYDDVWLIHLLYGAIEACEAYDSGTLFEVLVRINAGFKKMVARYDLKQDN